MENWIERAAEIQEALLIWLSSPQFYAQLAITGFAFSSAFVIAMALRLRLTPAKLGTDEGPASSVKAFLLKTRELIFPILAIVLLGIAIEVSARIAGQDFIVRIGQSLAVILLLYLIVENFIDNSAIVHLMRWVGIPVALLYVFGWLDDVTNYLDSISLELGNISFSAFDLTRTLFFGTLLFWLGWVSNATGKQVIRSQPALDMGTRELIAKLFEIFVFFLIFILMLQIIGINLTALTVFGGALGVGLGFGLQQIAANFISGIIILMDRSVAIGDYIELEEGRSGTIREIVASHPKVLSGPDIPVAERPDAEIAGFGDSGINILVEFWMEGIDDGENRVGADLLLMIWVALKEHGIEIPFPQREVKLLPTP
jgi:small-conductance mechanosensitive channel